MSQVTSRRAFVGRAARLLPDLMPIMKTADVMEGMRAFMERRPGNFQGR